MKRFFKVVPFLVMAISLLMAGCGTPAPTITEVYYDATTAANIVSYGPGSAADHEICVAFDAAKLAAHVGGQITSVKIYNPDLVGHSYVAQVFEADSGVNPPTLAGSSLSTLVPSASWATIDIGAPVTIQASKVYWAGYRINVSTGVWPFAVGLEADYGNNWMRTDGGSGAFTGCAYNWIVHIMVSH